MQMNRPSFFFFQVKTNKKEAPTNDRGQHVVSETDNFSYHYWCVAQSAEELVGLRLISLPTLSPQIIGRVNADSMAHFNLALQPERGSNPNKHL